MKEYMYQPKKWKAGYDMEILRAVLYNQHRHYYSISILFQKTTW